MSVWMRGLMADKWMSEWINGRLVEGMDSRIYD